jgi:uncharacterized protein (DUF4213/DUF364 family)
VTAYANAHINYLPENPAPGDIFDQIDFTGKENTVMIGYFPPLVGKFRDKGIKLSVFDQHQDYPDLTPASQLAEKLAGSDGVIVTATTLINRTFMEVISGIRAGAGIYLLGPSTPLYPPFLEQYGITRLFGMVFRPYDFEILEIIGSGSGTQTFSKKSKKISL